jgi:hypothetical protein
MAFNAGAIEATLDVQRNPFTEGLRKAQQQARDFEKKEFRAKLSVDADTNTARTNLERFRAAEANKDINIGVDVDTSQLSALRGQLAAAGVRIPVNLDKDGVSQQLGEIVNNTEKTAARSGNAIGRALLNPLVLQFGLLPGIAAVAAAGSAVALGAIVLGFGALAGAAQKNNPLIKASYSNMWKDIKSDTETITAPMVPYLLGVSGQIKRGFDDLKPSLSTVFAVLGPQVQDAVGGLTGLAKNALPGVTIAALNSNHAIEGLANLLKSAGTGISGFFTEISYKQADVGKGATYMGQIIERVLTTLGTLLAQFSTAFASIGPNFVTTFTMLLNILTQVTQGGLGTFSATLNILLPILNAVLSIIQPIAAGLGSMGGILLGVIAGWKLLGGSVGLVTKAFGLLAPAAIASRFASLTPMLAGAADRFGDLTTRVTGSGKAGDIAERSMTKVGTAIGKAASALPILGAAVIAGQAALDHFFPSADALAEKLTKGGFEAHEAAAKFSEYGDQTTIAGALQSQFGTSMEDTLNKVEEMRGKMTGLERAQMDATAAQNDLTYAQKTFGDYSPQAATAQSLLATATDRVEEAQKAAADATKSHTDRIIEQTNLMLGEVGARLNYQAGLLSLETAQKSLNDATKQHGATSLEARNADVAYQQSLVQVVTAIGQRATAEAEAKGITDTAAYAASAMNAEILRLAEAAGNNAPPALRQMVAGLSDTALNAIGARREVDNAGNAIIHLPDGKTLTFPNDADSARLKVQDLKAAVDAVPKSKTTTWYVNYIKSVTGQGPAISSGSDGLLPGSAIGGYAMGGPVRGPGGPRDDKVLRWLSNGEYVINSKDTAAFPGLLAYINSGRARKDYGMSTGGMVQAEDGSWVPDSFYSGAPAGPHAAYTASGFAKLRAQAQQYGISSLRADDQAQLRTYGGWIDPPAASQLPASNSYSEAVLDSKPANWRPSGNAFTSVNSWMGNTTPISLTTAQPWKSPAPPTGAHGGDQSLMGGQNQQMGNVVSQLSAALDRILQRAMSSLDGARLEVGGNGLAKIIRNETRLTNQQ